MNPIFKKGDKVELINFPEIKLTVLSIVYDSKGKFTGNYICNYSDEKESKNQSFMEVQLRLDK